MQAHGGWQVWMLAKEMNCLLYMLHWPKVIESLLAVFARAMTQANKLLGCTKSTKPRPPVLAWYRLTNPPTRS